LWNSAFSAWKAANSGPNCRVESCSSAWKAAKPAAMRGREIASLISRPARAIILPVRSMRRAALSISW
jgi:hypothetical protein